MPLSTEAMLSTVILSAWVVVMFLTFLTERFVSAKGQVKGLEHPSSKMEPFQSKMRFSILFLLVMTIAFALATNGYLLSRKATLAEAQTQGLRTQTGVTVDQIKMIGRQLGLRGDGPWDRVITNNDETNIALARSHRDRPAGLSIDLLAARLKRKLRLAETLETTRSELVSLFESNVVSQSEIIPRTDQVSLRRVPHLPVDGEVFYRELNIHIPADWSARIDLELSESTAWQPTGRALAPAQPADESPVTVTLRAGNNRLKFCLQAQDEASGDSNRVDYWLECNGEQFKLFETTRPSGWSYSGISCAEQADLNATSPGGGTTLVQLQSADWEFQTKASLITRKSDDE